MFINNLFESAGRQIVVIYPGRFQPFHRGHKAAYDYLAKKYGETVYIATSNKVDPPRSPFSFKEKEMMMALTGMDTSHVVQTTQPYRAMELVSQFNADSDILLFAISEKDMATDPRFQFKPKKNGDPSYFQKAPDDLSQCQPLSKHGYIVTVPTFNFKVLGSPMKSATEVRSAFSTMDDKTKKALIQDLFGNYSDEVFNLMTQKITEGFSQDEYNELSRAGMAKHTLMRRGAEAALHQATGFLDRIHGILKMIQDKGGPFNENEQYRFSHILNLINNIYPTLDPTKEQTQRYPTIEVESKNMAKRIDTFTKNNQKIGLWESRGQLLIINPTQKRSQPSSLGIVKTIAILESKGWIGESTDIIHMFKNAAGILLKVKPINSQHTAHEITDGKGKVKKFRASLNDVIRTLKNKGFKEYNGMGDESGLSLAPMEDQEPEESEQELMADRHRPKYGFQKRKLKY